LVKSQHKSQTQRVKVNELSSVNGLHYQSRVTDRAVEPLTSYNDVSMTWTKGWHGHACMVADVEWWRHPM